MLHTQTSEISRWCQSNSNKICCSNQKIPWFEKFWRSNVVSADCHLFHLANFWNTGNSSSMGSYHRWRRQSFSSCRKNSWTAQTWAMKTKFDRWVPLNQICGFGWVVFHAPTVAVLISLWSIHYFCRFLALSKARETWKNQQRHRRPQRDGGNRTRNLQLLGREVRPWSRREDRSIKSKLPFTTSYWSHTRQVLLATYLIKLGVAEVHSDFGCLYLAPQMQEVSWLQTLTHFERISFQWPCRSPLLTSLWQLLHFAYGATFLQQPGTRYQLPSHTHMKISCHQTSVRNSEI